MSIGVPVYNSERWVEQAVRSLLGQDLCEVEIVISDNASTDRTGEICRALAAQDTRVRYVRQEVNRGGAYNFNAVFALRDPRAPYFKWAAADDVYEPGYVSAAVAVLDADPGVVLVHSRTDDIDEEGRSLREWDLDLGYDDPDVAVRFRGQIDSDHECFHIFGVQRAAALAQTPGLGYYSESDRVLLAELVLHGRFADVPEVLFHRRQHGGRSVREYKSARSRIAWFNPQLVGRPIFPAWRIGGELLRALWRAPLSIPDRGRCMAQMVPWLRLYGPRMVNNVARTGLEELRRGRERRAEPERVDAAAR